jgi:sulfide:quinone oxidoreductase
MIDTTQRQSEFHLVIAGGGVAALEATLALRELAEDRVRVTLIAPRDEFVYRPMTVQEPFAFPRAARYSLAEIASDVGAELIQDAFGWVDPANRVAHTRRGLAIPYDALLLALGGRPHDRYPHALTVDDKRIDELLHGLVQDVEGGYVKSIAFVMPPRMAWPLPIYELALMMARRAYDANVEVAITVATPEDTPLAIFGTGASEAITTLLSHAGVQTIPNAYVEIPQAGHLVIGPGHRKLDVDRIVALPELIGPSIRGLPGGENGFIPVTPESAVRGVDRVYAAGDATDFPIKHGGIAAQQADAAARAIAALAGAEVEVKPFHPIIRGILLTGERPRYLTAQLVGGTGFRSQITDEPTWSPPMKIAAEYLSPYLDAREAQAVAR